MVICLVRSGVCGFWWIQLLKSSVVLVDSVDAVVGCWNVLSRLVIVGGPVNGCNAHTQALVILTY